MTAIINSKEFLLQDLIEIEINEYKLVFLCEFKLNIWLEKENKYYEFETYDLNVSIKEIINVEGSLIDFESIEWELNENFKKYIEPEITEYPSLSDNNKTITNKIELIVKNEFDKDYYYELIKEAEKRTVNFRNSL